MTQLALKLCDPSVERVERKRLSKQCAAILARLKEGPATNAELCHLALKYTSRISDLRNNGYVIQVIRRDHATGEVEYELL